MYTVFVVAFRLTFYVRPDFTNFYGSHLENVRQWNNTQEDGGCHLYCTCILLNFGFFHFQPENSFRKYYFWHSSPQTFSTQICMLPLVNFQECITLHLVYTRLTLSYSSKQNAMLCPQRGYLSLKKRHSKKRHSSVWSGALLKKIKVCWVGCGTPLLTITILAVWREKKGCQMAITTVCAAGCHDRPDPSAE